VQYTKLAFLVELVTFSLCPKQQSSLAFTLQLPILHANPAAGHRALVPRPSLHYTGPETDGRVGP